VAAVAGDGVEHDVIAQRPPAHPLPCAGGIVGEPERAAIAIEPCKRKRRRFRLQRQAGTVAVLVAQAEFHEALPQAVEGTMRARGKGQFEQIGVVFGTHGVAMQLMQRVAAPHGEEAPVGLAPHQPIALCQCARGGIAARARQCRGNRFEGSRVEQAPVAAFHAPSLAATSLRM
jgi:hypothetical protein